MSVTPSPPAPLVGRATPAQPLAAGGTAEPSAVAGAATERSAVVEGATETSAVPGADTEPSAGVGADAEPPALGGDDRDTATTGSSAGSSGVTASFLDESGGSGPYVAGNGRYVDGRLNPDDVPFMVVPATPGLAGGTTGNMCTAFPPLAGNSAVTRAAWTPQPEGATWAEGTARAAQTDRTTHDSAYAMGTTPGGATHETEGVAHAEGAADVGGAAHGPAHAEGTASAAHDRADAGGAAHAEGTARETAGAEREMAGGAAEGAERSAGSLTPGSSNGVVSFAPTTRMWAFLGCVTILGAVLGAVISHQFSPGFTAVTLVQGAPARLDPGALTQEDDRYVQTEAAYAGLADSEITEALTEQLDRTDVTAADVTVVPGTTILRFVGSGETNQLAADVANISAQTYVQTWRTRMSTALTESLAVIDAAAAESATGLLVDQRATLDTQLEAVQELQRIVQPASAQTAQATSNYAPGFILGALVGATLGLMALLSYRRRSFKPAGGGK